MTMQEQIDHVIATSTFRRNIYNMIPQGAKKILDFGCGNGALLFRLMRDKQCSDVSGVELNTAESELVKQVATKLWHVNIEQDFSPFEDYRGYFDYIVMHDVVEHLFDPWYTLPKIRSLLAPRGKLLIATPNFHYWALQHEVMSGRFPYGPGLWHTGHIRWYTLSSLVELLVIGGLSINTIYLEIPSEVDLTRYAFSRPITSFQIPPPEFQADYAPERRYTVTYEGDISKYCPVFYAHKLIVDCGKGPLYFEPAPTYNNCPRLLEMRDKIDNPFDIYNPPPMTPLIGGWN